VLARTGPEPHPRILSLI